MMRIEYRAALTCIKDLSSFGATEQYLYGYKGAQNVGAEKFFLN
jgi:hypothetical protein